MKKKIISLLMAAMISINTLPLNAFATTFGAEEIHEEIHEEIVDEGENEQNNGKSEETENEISFEATDENLILPDDSLIATEMESGSDEAANSVQTTAAVDEYILYSEAVGVLREALVNREEVIAMKFRTNADLGLNFQMKLMNRALEHTGNPVEGDYIECHMGGYSWSNKTSQTIDGWLCYTVTFQPKWYTNTEQEAELTTEIDRIMAELDLWDAEEYDKIRGVYEYICGNIRYDIYHKYDTDYKLQYTAYAGIMHGTCVCNGYAALLYRMMLELGVDCRVISGVSEDENHAWNIVKLGDVYYNMDSTWDGGLTTYFRYFLCTEENFGNHERDYIYTQYAFTHAYPMATEPYIVKAQASGTTGGLTWILDEEGVLTISGKGSMPDYARDAPWAPYEENISAIVLSEGITSVGDYAFCCCKYVTTVILPSTLKTIGQYGFDNCRSLRSIDLPEGLTTMEFCAFSECEALREIVLPGTLQNIGTSVFSNCDKLTAVTFAEGMTSIPNSMFYNSDSVTNVVFPSTLKTIGNTAFRDCDGLVTVTIPAGLTSLSTAVFSDCNKLQNFIVDAANPSYTAVNGVLFNKNKDTLVCYPAGRSGAYSVPDGTVTIAYAAFSEANKLTNIYFPSTLKTISGYAFAWCDGLNSVTISDSVERMEDFSFGACDYLRTVTIGKNVKYMDNAFYNFPHNALRYVYFTGNAPTFTNDAFYTNTITAYYPDNNSTWTTSVRQNYKGEVTWRTHHICNYVATVIPPTCTEQGYTIHQCSCGDTYYADYVSASGHNYTEFITEPSCTSYGYVTLYCLNCWDSYITEYIPAKDHTEITLSGKAATCTESGLTEGKKCSVCDTITMEQEMIPAKGHSEVTVAGKAATCTESGLTEGKKCSVCGTITVEQQTIPAMGHSEVTVAGKAATCTESGLTEGKKCSACGTVTVKQEVILAKGHSEVTVAGKAATCTESGLTEGKKCSVCGTITVEQQTIPAMGHSFVNGSCSVCGKIDPDFLKGDVNKDGTIDASDVNYTYRYVLGYVQLAAEQLIIVDINDDGSVNSADVNYLFRYVMGYVTDLTV